MKRWLDRLMYRLGYVPRSDFELMRALYYDAIDETIVLLRSVQVQTSHPPIVVTTDYQRGIPCS